MTVFAPWHKPWRNTEIATMVRMLGEGETYRTIATVLGRSKDAVEWQAKIARRKAGKTLRGPKKPTPAAVLPSCTISKADLPEFYSAGWRVVWFEGEQIGLEWPHADSPRIHDSPAVVTPLKLQSSETIAASDLEIA